MSRHSEFSLKFSSPQRGHFVSVDDKIRVLKHRNFLKNPYYSIIACHKTRFKYFSRNPKVTRTLKGYWILLGGSRREHFYPGEENQSNLSPNAKLIEKKSS